MKNLVEWNIDEEFGNGSLCMKIWWSLILVANSVALLYTYYKAVRVHGKILKYIKYKRVLSCFDEIDDIAVRLEVNYLEKLAKKMIHKESCVNDYFRQIP